MGQNPKKCLYLSLKPPKSAQTFKKVRGWQKCIQLYPTKGLSDTSATMESPSFFFRYHIGQIPWAHARHIYNQMERSCSEFVGTGAIFLPSPVFGFMGLSEAALPSSCHSSNLLIPPWYVMHALQSLI